MYAMAKDAICPLAGFMTQQTRQTSNVSSTNDKSGIVLLPLCFGFAVEDG